MKLLNLIEIAAHHKVQVIIRAFADEGIGIQIRDCVC